MSWARCLVKLFRTLVFPDLNMALPRCCAAGVFFAGDAGSCMPCSASRDVEWYLEASGQRSNALHIPSLLPLRFLRCCRVSLASSSAMDFSSATHLLGVTRPQSRSGLSSSSSWRPCSRRPYLLSCSSATLRSTLDVTPTSSGSALHTLGTTKTSPSSTSSTHFLNISEPGHSSGTSFL